MLTKHTGEIIEQKYGKSNVSDYIILVLFPEIVIKAYMCRDESLTYEQETLDLEPKC